MAEDKDVKKKATMIDGKDFEAYTDELAQKAIDSLNTTDDEEEAKKASKA